MKIKRIDCDQLEHISDEKLIKKKDELIKQMSEVRKILDVIEHNARNISYILKVREAKK